jgi:hypothetical protein
MDNKIFNINGEGVDLLKQVLNIAIKQEDWAYSSKINGWAVDQAKGFILLSYVNEKRSDECRFPVPVSPEMAAMMAYEWLSSEEAKKVPCQGWDADTDHDGSNELGWRVYCEEWGHVGNYHNAIVAIKPVYLWYGK